MSFAKRAKTGLLCWCWTRIIMSIKAGSIVAVTAFGVLLHYCAFHAVAKVIDTLELKYQISQKRKQDIETLNSAFARLKEGDEVICLDRRTPCGLSIRKTARVLHNLLGTQCCVSFVGTSKDLKHYNNYNNKNFLKFEWQWVPVLEDVPKTIQFLKSLFPDQIMYLHPKEDTSMLPRLETKMVDLIPESKDSQTTIETKNLEEFISFFQVAILELKAEHNVLWIDTVEPLVLSLRKIHQIFYDPEKTSCHISFSTHPEKFEHWSVNFQCRPFRFRWVPILKNSIEATIEILRLLNPGVPISFIKPQ